jgi:rfaE bifunctional protein nucleotidyltransferase chain/domain
MGLVVSLEEARRLRDQAKTSGRRVVLTNGYFDILHVGHVRYLQAARALADVLIVAVNADSTAARSKDPRRPIVGEMERAEVLAALSCVDYVVVFEEDTAERVVSLLRPDLYVKGGDYDRSSLPEAPVVESYGGQIAILPFETGHSTTAIIETIRDRYGRVRSSP